MKENNGAVVRILTIIVFLFMSHEAVWADDKNSPNYIRFSSGFYQPTGDLDDADYDSGGDVTFFLGRYLGKYLIFEGGAGFFYTDRETVGSTPLAGFYIEEDNVGAFSLTATAKGVYPIGKLEFFGGGGIGGYFVNLDTEVKSSEFGNTDTDDDDTVFGFHVTGGVQYKIAERFLLGGEVKYLWTDDIDIRKPIADIPVRLQGDLNGYTVNFTFGYRF